MPIIALIFGLIAIIQVYLLFEMFLFAVIVFSGWIVITGIGKAIEHFTGDKE